MNSEMTEQIARLKILVADLKCLQAHAVSAADLLAAPVLNHWKYSVRRAACMEGFVEGHPLLTTGKCIVTSEVFAHFYTEDEHFVRALSRWYRLGNRNLVTQPLESSRPTPL